MACLEESFEIPELPSGNHLHIHLISNWGDNVFIGMNGIEIFTNDGKRAEVEEISSENIDNTTDLPNIFAFESVFCGKQKMWKTRKHGEDQEMIIKVVLKQPVKLAMIRIWNYSESRVHAQIGVRHLQMKLDKQLIFRGEINISYTTTDDIDQMGDTVLFTTDEHILELIADNDVCLIGDVFNQPTSVEIISPDEELLVPTACRPPTAEIGPISKLELNERPSSEKTKAQMEQNETKVKVLQFELISNWGHPDSIGLTGVGLMDIHGDMIPMKNVSMTSSTPHDENLQKLINGRNLTRNADDMWLTSFDGKNNKTTITLTFPVAIQIHGISVWNYNSSPELSYAGVRQLNVYVNGKIAIANVLLRKATGFVYYDFVQDILFDSPVFLKAASVRPTTNTVSGFVFQLLLHSTWGDEFYIGLNGIQLFNRKNESIKLKTHNLAAFPESVNILPSVDNDPRTSAKLIDGVNDTEDASHMWLTPLLPNRCARIFFIFDVPTYVSRITIYNYRKTPQRGVRHFTISIDDFIVYSGEVPESTEESTGMLNVDLRET